MSKEPIRIAQIMGKWVGGGVESVIMNYYSHINRKEIQFDFFCDEDSTNIPYDKIERLGGKVIIIPPYQKIFKYIRTLTRILKENKYQIIHSNINALSVFPLFCAYVAKIPIRIAHSHSTTNKKEVKKNILKILLRPFSKIFANRFFACSEHAGRWLFGKKFDKKGILINNAIDSGIFDYNEKVRDEVRKDLNIENKLVIGHVGRFIEQKNHYKIIEVFDKCYKKNKDVVLLLIGEGKLKKEIISKCFDLGLQKNVIFLGQRDDVNRIFQAMDVFLFPSLYEGLGMVLIEAQCSGLRCVASSNVPSEAKITDVVEFLSLDEENEVWAEKILKENNYLRKSFKESVILSGYDINNEAIKLEKKYLENLKYVKENNI